MFIYDQKQNNFKILLKIMPTSLGEIIFWTEMNLVIHKFFKVKRYRHSQTQSHFQGNVQQM